MVKVFTKLFRPKIFVAGVLLALVSAFGVSTLTYSNAVAAKCDPNDIVDCGVPTKQSVVNAYNGSTEIKGIYDGSIFGGLQPSELSRFLATAVEGTAYKNGQIILKDGRVVATAGSSLGRLSGGNPYTIKINGKDYHWGYNSTAFNSNSLPVWVMMDANDKYMEFAVIKDCGNPITGTKPVFECKELKKEETSDPATFKFWTKVDLKNSTVKNVHYDFGDGKTADEKDPNKKVSHTFKPGNWHVKVTVTYIVNGHEQSETLQIKCQTDVEVKEKKVVAKCDNLQAFLIEGTHKYDFVGTASFENATITNALFIFGDGQTGPGAVDNTGPNNAEITASHQYAGNLLGKKMINLDVTFSTKDGTKTSTCKVEIEFKEKTCADEPNRPECQPPKCIPKEGEDSKCKILPKETCVPAKGEDDECNIPDTGPEAIIGSALGLGSLAGAGMYYRASRKNLRDLIKR